MCGIARIEEGWCMMMLGCIGGRRREGGREGEEEEERYL